MAGAVAAAVRFIYFQNISKIAPTLGRLSTLNACAKHSCNGEAHLYWAPLGCIHWAHLCWARYLRLCRRARMAQPRLLRRRLQAALVQI